jgi:hypothetical protein
MGHAQSFQDSSNRVPVVKQTLQQSTANTSDRTSHCKSNGVLGNSYELSTNFLTTRNAERMLKKKISMTAVTEPRCGGITELVTYFLRSRPARVRWTRCPRWSGEVFEGPDARVDHHLSVASRPTGDGRWHLISYLRGGLWVAWSGGRAFVEAFVGQILMAGQGKCPAFEGCERR